jgi:hypothetical protein
MNVAGIETEIEIETEVDILRTKVRGTKVQ